MNPKKVKADKKNPDDTKPEKKKGILSRWASRGRAKPHFEDFDPDPDVAKQWLTERGRQYSNAFAVETEFVKQEQEFKSSREVAIEYLENVLCDHDTNCAPNQPKFYDCPWECVFDQLAQAKDGYSSQHHPGKAALAGYDLTSKLTDLIPEEYGLGVIKGVLGLVFESVKRRVENKEKILGAFQTLPETILTINIGCLYLDPEPGDVDLLNNFYENIVTQLPDLVQILVGEEPWYKKAFSFLSLQTHDSMTIDEVLSRWNRCIDILKGRIENMKNRSIAKLVHNTSDMKTKLTEATHKLAEANGNIVVLGTKMDSVLSKFDKLDNLDNLKDLLYGAAREVSIRAVNQVQSSIQAQNTGAQAQTEIFRMMQGLVRSRDRENDNLRRENSQLLIENAIQRAATPVPPEPEPQIENVAIFTHLQLLSILGIPPQESWDDLDYVFQQSSTFKNAILGRARWLLKTDEFVSWVTDQYSSLLLVEGNLPNCTNAVTPLSVFCSTFVCSLVESPSSIVLFFFGGLHAVEGETSHCGPSGLMRSLASQLLLSEKFPRPDLSFLTEDLAMGCEEQNIRALCELFKQLLLQVPPDMQVFCVLDGLADFEEGPWSQDLDYVAATFEHLTQCMDDFQMQGLKALIMFAGQSLEISDRIPGSGWWKQVSLAAGYVDSMQMSTFTTSTALEGYY